MVWTRPENQIKPINDWNKGEHYRHEVYDDLPRPVIQPDMDPAEHTGAISAEIVKMKQKKKFESLNMSQLKRRATIEIVEQIE